jgi:hypothetical protein
VFKKQPRLLLFALSDICPNQEILYRYADEKNQFWTNKVIKSLNIRFHK